MNSKLGFIALGLWIAGANRAPAAWAADAGGGKALYEKSCVGCHGADGKGNEKMATVLGAKSLSIVGQDTTKKTDEQLLKVLAEGTGKMPASKLTNAEQKQVLGYVKTLAK